MVSFHLLSFALIASLGWMVATIDLPLPSPESPFRTTPLDPPSARPSTYPGLPSPSPVNAELRAELELPKVTTLGTVWQGLELRDAPDPSKLLGYTFTFGTFSPWHCHSGTFLTVSGYARCCEKDIDCPMYTACESTSVLKNDKYRMTCNGTSSQSVCVTGTIFDYVGDLNPKLYINCWSNWTDGDWKATRTTTSLNATLSGIDHGDSSIGKGKLAGIIVGALVGLALLVAFGVLAAKFVSELRKTRFILQERAQESSQDNKRSITDKGVDVEITPLEGVYIQAHSKMQPRPRGAPEFSGKQLDPHEMDTQRPRSVRTGTGSVSQFEDAQEHM